MTPILLFLLLSILFEDDFYYPKTYDKFGTEIIKEFFIPDYYSNGVPSAKGENFVELNLYDGGAIIIIKNDDYKVVVNQAESREDEVRMIREIIESHRAVYPTPVELN